MQGAQRSAETLNNRSAVGQVRRRPYVVQGSAGQAFGDIPRPVRPVAVGDVPSVWDPAAGEQFDDGSLVTIRVAVPLVVDQPYNVFVAYPHAANPAGLRKK